MLWKKNNTWGTCRRCESMIKDKLKGCGMIKHLSPSGSSGKYSYKCTHPTWMLRMSVPAVLVDVDHAFMFLFEGMMPFHLEYLAQRFHTMHFEGVPRVMIQLTRWCSVKGWTQWSWSSFPALMILWWYENSYCVSKDKWYPGYIFIKNDKYLQSVDI